MRKAVVPVGSIESTVRFPWVWRHSEIWIEWLLWVELRQLMFDTVETNFGNGQITSRVLHSGNRYIHFDKQATWRFSRDSRLYCT
jgi:hypothetical protein